MGSNGDKNSEESCLERQLLELCAGHTTSRTTSHDRMKGRLLFCPPPVKRPSFLHTNSEFNVLGLVGFV
jgi:hypothetical protein